jgi:hypothetical protein
LLPKWATSLPIPPSRWNCKTHPPNLGGMPNGPPLSYDVDTEQGKMADDVQETLWNL